MKSTTVAGFRISFCALGLLLYAQLAASDCYFPNGTLNPDLEIQPCNRYQYSTCCSNNKTTIGQTFPVANDVCNENGLCQNWQTQGDTTYETWWRVGCSDPTWNSPYCLKNICWDETNGSAILSNCTNGVWCCGWDINDPNGCCNNASATFKLAATVGPTSTSTSSIKETSSTSTTQAPATSTPADQTKHRDSSKVGIAVGVTFGILALGALVGGILFWRWRKKSIQRSGKGERSGRPAELATGNMRAEMEARRIHETDGVPVSELQ